MDEKYEELLRKYDILAKNCFDGEIDEEEISEEKRKETKKRIINRDTIIKDNLEFNVFTYRSTFNPNLTLAESIKCSKEGKTFYHTLALVYSDDNKIELGNMFLTISDNVKQAKTDFINLRNKIKNTSLEELLNEIVIEIDKALDDVK